MRVDAFDFDLPRELIALRPAAPRDSARLLEVRVDAPGDFFVRDLPDLLRPGDCLVLNDTRVIPARLFGRRVGRGDAEPGIEAMLHQRRSGNVWVGFARPGRKLAVGDRVRFGERGETCLAGTLDAVVVSKGGEGEIELAFELDGDMLDEAIAGHGTMPLPPYIASRRDADSRDRDDYQTVYARDDGAVAAPTAGLHFTPELFRGLEKRGIGTEFVTLHVGAGTFLPVRVDDTGDHRMHSEWGSVPGDVAERLNARRAAGGRIVSVGTTSLRLLETATRSGRLEAFSGDTDIFITPGFEFRAVDLLLTNFHLPRSTLFMLVSAFSGLDRMQEAYAHAIAGGYRFYSYGDACLLHPAGRT